MPAIPHKGNTPPSSQLSPEEIKRQQDEAARQTVPSGASAAASGTAPTMEDLEGRIADKLEKRIVDRVTAQSEHLLSPDASTTGSRPATGKFDADSS